MKGSTYRRCYCRGENGRPLGKACPQLSSRRHGTWAIRQELPPRADGTRRSFSRSGYDSSKAAQAALDQVRAILALPDSDDETAQVRVGDLLEEASNDKKAPLPSKEDVRRRLFLATAASDRMTIGQLLDDWLEVKRRSRRKSTLNGYEGHVRNYLRPHLGQYRTDRLGVPHAQAMFDRIQDNNEVIAAENAARREQVARCKWTKPGRPPAADRERLKREREALAEMPPFRKVADVGTQHAIRRSLHAVLEYGIGRQAETGMQLNVAKYVELSPYRRPQGLLWTEERVQRWRETGKVPSPVMVWTPVQLGVFLDAAESSRFYAGFHVVAHHGLRRGECVGQEWAEVSYRRRRIRVSRSITVDGWTPYEDAPKTEDSAAEVAVDTETVAVLQAHRARQEAERDARLADGLPWTDSGKVLTREDGTPIHPEELSDEFRRILAAAGLPPINLRDLRHGTAGLVKAAGGDIHDAKAKLRHSSIKLTSDTYMTLFEELEDELAEKIAAVVPRARKDAGDTAAHASLTQEDEDDEAPGSA